MKSGPSPMFLVVLLVNFVIGVACFSGEIRDLAFFMTYACWAAILLSELFYSAPEQEVAFSFLLQRELRSVVAGSTKSKTTHMPTLDAIENKAKELLEVIAEEKIQIEGVLEGKEISIRDLKLQIGVLNAKIAELENGLVQDPEALQRIFNLLAAAETQISNIVPDEPATDA